MEKTKSNQKNLKLLKNKITLLEKDLANLTILIRSKVEDETEVRNIMTVIYQQRDDLIERFRYLRDAPTEDYFIYSKAFHETYDELKDAINSAKDILNAA